MSRFLSGLALAISIFALVVASLAVRRSRSPDRVAEEPSVGRAVPEVARVTDRIIAPAGGISADEAAAMSAEAVRKREQEMVDRLWPRVARIRAKHKRSVPAKPAKLDDVLGLYLDFDDPEGEAQDDPAYDLVRKETDCKNRLKQIGVYFSMFESKFRYFPGSFDDLKRPEMLSESNVKLLRCLFDTSADATSYEYLHPVRGNVESPDAIIAYDKHVHPTGRRCVLFFMGRVDSPNEADFQKMLADQLARDRANIGDEVVKARAAVLDQGLSETDRHAAEKRLSILESLNR